MKWCPSCKNFSDNFGKDKHRPDGFASFCRPCRSKRYKAAKASPDDVIYWVATEYPNRGSIPENLRGQFDSLTTSGTPVYIETPSGKRTPWTKCL